MSFNENLQQLFVISRKKEKIAIGLMSGTSLDGLDIALCRFTGSGLYTQFELLQFTTTPYNDHFKQEVQSVFSRQVIELEMLTLLNAYIGNFHAGLVLNALLQWNISPADVDFIASHGQTVYHAPKRAHRQDGYPNATLQIGDGDHIAVKTGILTISDFRQKHIAAGGEGAPLALYGDVILGSKPGEDRILLNIGGIANLTYLPADSDRNKVICADTGPGNTLIDAACRQYFNKPYDQDSGIALSGTVNEQLLDALLNHPYFIQKAPKTTGPELFNMAYLDDALMASGNTKPDPADIICTLSAFTARTIAGFIKDNLPGSAKIFVSGGGAKNLFVINCLKHLLPGASLSDTKGLGMDPDAKEAILFALLGNEAICGHPFPIGTNPAVLMGKFSFPY